MKKILLISLLSIGSTRTIVKTKRTSNRSELPAVKDVSIPVQHIADTSSSEQRTNPSEKSNDTTGKKRPETHLLNDSHYAELANNIYETLAAENNLTEKAKALKPEQVIRKIQGNLHSIARKTRLSFEIVDTSIEEFIVELSDYLVEKERYATKPLSTKERDKILRCIKKIKDSIPQTTQLAIAKRVLENEEAKKARAVVNEASAKLQKLGSDTKRVTIDAANEILHKTEENLAATKTETVAKLAEVKDSFVKTLIKSVSNALMKMFNVTPETEKTEDTARPKAAAAR